MSVNRCELSSQGDGYGNQETDYEGVEAMNGEEKEDQRATVANCMVRVVWWFFVNAGFAGLMWMALAEKAEWASNVLLYWINFQAFLVIVLLLSEDMRKRLKAKGHIVPLWMDHAYDAAAIVAFASQGWFWSATVMLLSLLAIAITHQKSES